MSIRPLRRMASILTLALATVTAPAMAAPVAGSRDQMIRVAPGVGIHVVVAGPQTAEPPLVLIPGWRLTAAVWRDQIAEFSKTRQVITIDPRSQGESTKTGEGDTPEDRARDVRAVLAALGTGPVVLVGWSQGVQDVAAYVMQFGSSQLRGVVLVDSTISAGFAAQPPAAVEQQLRQISQFVRYPREATEGMMRAIIHRPLTAAQLEALVTDALKTPTAIGAAMLTDDLLGLDRRPALAKLTVPTLVVASDSSQELEGQRAMAAQLRNGRFHAVPDAGHAVFVDQPEAFNALLRDFLAELR